MLVSYNGTSAKWKSSTRLFFEMELENRNINQKHYALRGNRTPGGSNQYTDTDGNDPGYHYPINACKMCDA